MDNRAVVRRLAAVADGPTLTLPDSTLDEFMARWAEGNARVARQHLGDEDGVLFRAPRKTDDTTSQQRLDPARLDHFLEVAELPEEMDEPLRILAEQEVDAS